MPHDQTDLCRYARNHEIAPEAVSQALGLTAQPIERGYRDIDGKRRTARPLHLGAQLLEPFPPLEN